MAKFSALLSLLLLLAAASTAHSQTTTTFNYDFDGTYPSTLTFQGYAQFMENSPNLTLTSPTTPNTVGRVVHTAPVPFKSGGRPLVSFYSTIKFYITPTAANLPGEGIAFFVAPVGTTYPRNSYGGYLGLFDVAWEAPSTLVVEFDTNPNEGYDPSYPHIGIDIGTIISSNVTNMYNLMVGQEVTAEISYVSATSRITVRLIYPRGVIYEVSTMYYLPSFLPDQVQFGLSASTSYNLAIQNIVSWHNNYTVADSSSLIRQVVV